MENHFVSLINLKHTVGLMTMVTNTFHHGLKMLQNKRTDKSIPVEAQPITLVLLQVGLEITKYLACSNTCQFLVTSNKYIKPYE